MAKIEHDKPPFLALRVLSPPCRASRVIQGTIRLLILATSTYFLALYLSAYVHSAKVSVWRLVALALLLATFALRLAPLVVGHRNFSAMSYRIFLHPETGYYVFWHFVLLVVWLYHIFQIETVILQGLNLARQSARLSGFGNNGQMEWNEGMKYSQSEAQKILAKDMAQWEVDSGFLGYGVYLTQLWARAPRVAGAWFCGLFWLAMCLAALLIQDYLAMLKVAEVADKEDIEAFKVTDGLSDVDYTQAVLYRPLEIKEALLKEATLRKEAKSTGTVV